MNLSISHILSESWEDFKKLLVNPVVFILFLVSSSLSLLPDFIQEDSSPLLALLIIPLVLLMLFIYAYQVKLIYSLKTGGTQNIFPEVLSAYPRYLWYTLIFAGIFIVATLVVAIPAAVLYFTMGNQSWLLFLDIALIAIYLPTVIYLCIRLFFYAYLIIIEKDDTPLSTSWAMTKNYFWGILLLFFIPILVVVVIAVAVSLVLTFVLNIQETTIDIVLLPLDIIAGIYMAIVFLNAFLFCRSQSKPQQKEPQAN